jgi:hypothetical protein
MSRIAFLLSVIIVGSAFTSNSLSAQEQLEVKKPRCRETNLFNVCLLELWARGSSVWVSVSVTNKTDKAIPIHMEGELARLVAPSGEQREARVNGFDWNLAAKATEQLGYYFRLSNPVESGGKFDFVLAFDRPSISNFGFLNVPSSDGEPTKPSCRRDQFFEACVMDVSLKGKSIAVDFALKNISSGDVQIALYGAYALVRDSKGHEAERRTNQATQVVTSGGTVQMSETFTLQQPAEGNVIDVMFILDKPYSMFGFYNIKAN